MITFYGSLIFSNGVIKTKKKFVSRFAEHRKVGLILNYTSILFLSLLLVVHLLAQALIPSNRGKNTALLIASLALYAWAGPVYLLVLLALTLLAWLLGKAMGKSPAKGARTGMLTCGLVVIVGILVVLKYGRFLLGSFQHIFGVPAVLPEIVIPLGIGVYTLRLISYLLDVYRGEIPAETDYLSLLIWSSLFYGLSVGPLFHYKKNKHALEHRKFRLEGLNRGISRICMGLGKKYLLADSLAILVDQYLVRSREGLSAVPVTGLWLGIILSALRMYLLFSAYGDVAVGLSLATGMPVEESFRYPLCSVSVTGFVRKWFISIGDFFRTNVEQPIADRSGSKLLGTVVCCVLFGLWFGDSWSFALWGLWIAVCMTAEPRLGKHLHPLLSGLLGWAGIFLSFTFLSFTTLSRLGIALRGLVGLNGNGFFQATAFSGLPGSLPLILVCILFAVPTGTIVHNLWHGKFQNQPKMLMAAAVWENIWPLALIVLAVLYTLLGHGAAFLTF